MGSDNKMDPTSGAVAEARATANDALTVAAAARAAASAPAHHKPLHASPTGGGAAESSLPYGLLAHTPPAAAHHASLPHNTPQKPSAFESAFSPEAIRKMQRDGMTPLEHAVETVTHAIPGGIFGNQADFNHRVVTGNLTDEQLVAFAKGGQRITEELAANPALMRAHGAHPAENGKPKSLGSLDLNGDGKFLATEGMAIAAALDERRTGGSTVEMIAKELGSASLMKRAASIMHAIDAATGEPAHEPAAPCKAVAFRIIPCEKGSSRS